jgi:hypothetical protein
MAVVWASIEAMASNGSKQTGSGVSSCDISAVHGNIQSAEPLMPEVVAVR